MFKNLELPKRMANTPERHWNEADNKRHETRVIHHWKEQGMKNLGLNFQELSYAAEKSGEGAERSD